MCSGTAILLNTYIVTHGYIHTNFGAQECLAQIVEYIVIEYKFYLILNA